LTFVALAKKATKTEIQFSFDKTVYYTQPSFARGYGGWIVGINAIIWYLSPLSTDLSTSYHCIVIISHYTQGVKMLSTNKKTAPLIGGAVFGSAYLTSLALM